ncbi:MAG: hypothetical protein NTY38_20170 [Acidobacteria bacterium]|nr:hypothetical protein [Acidobacteriota bacterium]
MDTNKALRYSLAWARTVRATADDLAKDGGGSFHGMLGPLHFEYQADKEKLIVRGVAAPFLKTLPPAVLAELRRIQHEQPDRVAHAEFEYLLLPWRKGKVHSPSLYLRLEFAGAELSEDEFVIRARELRDTALLWSTARFDKVLDDVLPREKK